MYNKRSSYMKKADYGEIANTYDIARPLSEENLDLWLVLISEKIGPRQKVEFLELGCGTGRFAIPMAIRLGYSVTGADNSEEMLLKAGKKEGAEQIKWDIQNATSLSYPNESFDVVFMSHLLHHVDEPLNIVKECYRILRSKGLILNRYGPIEHICHDPEHVFFSGTTEIDEARTPTIIEVENWFRTAGFNNVSSETISQKTYKSAKERLEKAELKSTSVLTLISQSLFIKGLETFRKYISDNPNDPWPIMDKITLSIGEK